MIARKKYYYAVEFTGKKDDGAVVIRAFKGIEARDEWSNAGRQIPGMISWNYRESIVCVSEIWGLFPQFTALDLHFRLSILHKLAKRSCKKELFKNPGIRRAWAAFKVRNLCLHVF